MGSTVRVCCVQEDSISAGQGTKIGVVAAASHSGFRAPPLSRVAPHHLHRDHRERVAVILDDRHGAPLTLVKLAVEALADARRAHAGPLSTRRGACSTSTNTGPRQGQPVAEGLTRGGRWARLPPPHPALKPWCRTRRFAPL